LQQRLIDNDLIASVDKTDELMAELDLPTHPPAFDDLAAVLDAGLRRTDGTKALLPVQQTLYDSMQEWGKVRRMIEPESVSSAFALSASISAALRRRIVEPSDEIIQAGTFK
jgi:hypothetical protein